MKIVKGNLIDKALAGEFDIIVHGCNCQCRMKSGIAKEIAARIPEAEAADNATTKGDASKLGSWSHAHTMPTDGHYVTVINAYTQVYWGTDSRKVDYGAIRKVFRSLSKALIGNYEGYRVGYPKIGCGLAGGDWEIVSKIIDEELEGCDHTCVELD